MHSVDGTLRRRIQRILVGDLLGVARARISRISAGPLSSSIAFLRETEPDRIAAALDQLLKYPMYANMPIVATRYWPMVHGNAAADVEQDLEGLQIMRQMARNMVWMLRCIQAGREAGIPLPEHEPERIATNFIR